MEKNEQFNEEFPLEINKAEALPVGHKLVCAVVKKGYGYQVIKTATENNGKGAFLMDGRGMSKEKRKLFGFEIAPERELVLMVVEEKYVYPIMKAIYAIADFKSNAKGVVFALPIDFLLD